MASSWRDPATPILDLGRRTGGRYAEKRRRLVLWPVWLWDVVAPDLTGRRLDVLERAVLGYADAGIRDSRRLATALGLDRQLIAKVWSSLRSNELLDDEDRLTPDGRTALSDARAARGQLVSAVVVVEAFQGLPLALELGRLERHTASWEEGFPIIQTGTEGRPGPTLRPYLLDAGWRSPVQPAPERIAKLAADASRPRRDAGETETLADAEVARFSEQVSVVGQARRAFVPVDLMAEELLPDALSVRLPRSSPRLVREFLKVVEEVRREHPGLERQIGELFNDVSAEVAEQGVTDGFLPQAAARARVTARCGSRLEAYAEPFEQLVALDRKCHALRHLPSPARDSIEDVITAAQKAVEAACETLRVVPRLRRWPWERESGTPKEVTYRRLAGAARMVGFHFPSPESAEGVRLAAVTPGKLFSAFMHGGGSVLPKVLSLMVYASVEPSHPIRDTAAVAPDLLFGLVALDRYRNPSSHGGRRDDDPVPTVEDAVRFQRVAERAVTALLGIPMGHVPDEADSG
jgi:hypothetical protein